MVKYRPDGFKNPYSLKSVAKQRIYEAGADAMLEELKKGGYKIAPNDQDYIMTKMKFAEFAWDSDKELQFRKYPCELGTLVFIPDSKNQGGKNGSRTKTPT